VYREGIFSVSGLALQGSEVPQVYIGPPPNPPPLVQFAPQKLAGFTRVVLDPGQSERVAVHISSRELSYWSTQAQDWVLGAGQRKVYVGASSRDIRLQGSAQVRSEHGR
jgi:beta-glucosidase